MPQTSFLSVFADIVISSISASRLHSVSVVAEHSSPGRVATVGAKPRVYVPLRSLLNGGPPDLQQPPDLVRPITHVEVVRSAFIDSSHGSFFMCVVGFDNVRSPFYSINFGNYSNKKAPLMGGDRNGWGRHAGHKEKEIVLFVLQYIYRPKSRGL